MSRIDFDHEVAIVGSGFSGMAAAIELDRAGLPDFVLLEKAGDIGGTWRDNQYPGACCDVPSHLYSFSYALNPDWSHRFSPAKEIHAYQKRVRDEYDLGRRIRCGFDVVSAEYFAGGWDIESAGGERLRVRYLISAIGALQIPYKPLIPGLNDFKGKVMHSAEWDQDYDPRGKKVVIIGSAASAVQIVPKIAEVADRLTVMQRTPNYFIPRKDRKISAFERNLFRKFPLVQKLYRWRQYLVNDYLFHANFSGRASLRKMFLHHLVHRHMKKQVKDPALLQKLTPDYEIGCKRLLLSDDYLPAIQKDHVDLVTDGIDRFTGHTLLTRTGQEIEADLVVLATGFETVHIFDDLRITGPDGISLDQAWAKEIRAHRSVAVKGFPNLFLMLGPNSGLGHSSILIMLEEQARYISALLKKAHHSRRPTILVRADSEQAHNQAMQKALANTVWNTGCNSWYKDEQGRIFSLWPYTTTRFIREMRKVRLGEYRFYNDEPAI